MSRVSTGRRMRRWLAGVTVVAALMPISTHAQTAPLHTAVPGGRLIGVYDDQSGEPLADAQVLDLGNGWSVKTSPTGTALLFFVDTAGGLIRISKLGYTPVTMLVQNSSRDTVPLTVTMARAGQLLPRVVSRARHALLGPADTVRRLSDVGFYDRRATTGAPSNAFVTADKLDRMLTLDDLARNLATASGRGICAENLYIDGVRVRVPSRVVSKGRISQTLASPVDMIIPVGNIAGVEMYTTSDAPEEFNATRAAGALYGCATLIWTK